MCLLAKDHQQAGMPRNSCKPAHPLSHKTSWMPCARASLPDTGPPLVLPWSGPCPAPDICHTSTCCPADSKDTFCTPSPLNGTDLQTKAKSFTSAAHTFSVSPLTPTTLTLKAPAVAATLLKRMDAPTTYLLTSPTKAQSPTTGAAVA